MAKFLFQTMGYSPWGSKNLFYWNQLKKFMQVGVNATCMYTNFGGCSFSNFGDIATFKNSQISLSYSPWSAKNLINWNLFKKFMQVGIDVTCMQANFGVCSFSNFRDIATFKNSHYSPWSAKKLIDWNQLKKFMPVGIDVTCMHTNFSGCSFSNFGDIATFKNSQISLSDHGL